MLLVVSGLVVGLLLNLLPWEGFALRAHPDFVLIMLLYWSVHESRTVGQGAGFVLGLVMDVADSALLGQHAFVYVGAIHLAQMIRVRLLQLTVVEQALHVLTILFAAQLTMVALNLAMGREFPGFAMALSPLLGAMVWPIANWLTNLSRFRRRSNGGIS